MKIYIVCSVRNATDSVRVRLEALTDWLEYRGHDVHLPHRDTDQEATGLEICMENAAAISMADEIFVVYDKDSQGSHFDLGMVFALDMLEGRKKRIRVVMYNGLGFNKMTEGKSFYRMLAEWGHEQSKHSNLYPKEYESKELDISIPVTGF